MAGSSSTTGSGSRGSTPMYGGQAVIEGVMMRGAQHFAVACRRASGEIALTCEMVPKVLRPAWQKWPFLRGGFALVDSMALGTKALFWAARIAEADIPQTEEKEKAEIRASEETVGAALGTAVVARDPLPIAPSSNSASSGIPPSPTSRVTEIAMGSAMVVGLAFSIGLFKLLPQVLVSGVKAAGVEGNVKLGLIDLSIRFTLFFGYILLVSRMKHVFRVFQYHGAEHKAINALEAGGPLTVETARAASRLHPRCGTSFVFIVLLLSVMAVVPFYGQPLWARLLIQLAMVFPVAGVSFELLRLAGRFRHNPVAAALSRPGMWTQLLTTREPDDSQIEIALASLKAVMDKEEDERIRGTRSVDAALTSPVTASVA